MRYLAYGCGIAGAVLMLTGRGLEGSSGDTVRMISSWLLLAMFALFVMTYIMSGIALLRRDGDGRR